MAYIVVSYVKATEKGKITRNRWFDALMVAAPWSVLFDGLTAWTVNHLAQIPRPVNNLLHLIFFLSMDVMIIITSMYMYDQLVGFCKTNKKRNLPLFLPGVLSLVLIIAGINRIEYLHGEITNYSMGFSVYVCYASLLFHYGAILYLVIARHRFLPKDKMLGTVSFIEIVGVILVIQIIFPEVLLTSICPTVLMLGIYIDFENPSIRKLTQYNEEMADGFATMVENRDNSTGGHIKRTRSYVNLMLHKMRHNKRYQDIVNKDYLIHVSNAAPLHDIGKIATPDRILQKPGKLTDEEYEIMKEHAARGGEIIQNTFQNLESPEFQKIAYEIARYHHEKYNGKGYPDGISGERIPLHARVMAIADVFDAVSQKRCYRDAMPIDACFAIIEKGAGTDFDPNLVSIFLEAREEVEKLMGEF
ncbi:MAG: HD domain-containing protein [Roseburia sp.]|uniref:HD-GYP domain-containing protein n=1 Tax=Roseburia sp. 831b TaxID=1261635 RepID=UPI00135628A4|nr:HD domain-containing phosphohydrolase [Roseburia sp. 831b]MCI5919157.1 HD domain-containing protein [Roseburia sp.]MDD6217151.1 HD domain-containing protein [Roseburia sp.]MDY5883054.1 HD domain-containing protein [Roseburia sp.]WVK74569.1 HD domain-containing protein [Roseburia sp. 831b]